MKRSISEQLFEKAKRNFPGGVNSPVRAFNSVEGSPLFIDKGDGCKIWDADGNEFTDFCCSWGPLILGHNNKNVAESIKKTVDNGTSFGAPTRLENELGDLIISNNRFIEQIRFVNSGTEATMSAIRMARGFTGRKKIIKFEGCYHGHADALLVKAGSGLATLGASSSAGVPENYTKETIVLPLNDREAVLLAAKQYKDDIACIILEPIPANNGLLLQDVSYLKFLREICDEEGILLFFDEVISGFRVGFEGAAGLYDIKPDIVAYGKIIGGGMPVGAYASSEKIMSCIAPLGPVYQAGTLSGNPVAMAAGIAQLSELMKPGFYEDQEARTQKFVGQILAHTEAKGYPFHIFSIGSIFWMAFSDNEAIRSADEVDAESMEDFKKLYTYLLEHGIYMGPSGYEVGFVSAAHDEVTLADSAAIICAGLDVVFGK